MTFFEASKNLHQEIAEHTQTWSDKDRVDFANGFYRTRSIVLTIQNASLVAALEKCWEYFDNRYDGAPDAHCQDMIEPMEAAQKALQLARGGK